jgi:hypothetical protein
LNPRTHPPDIDGLRDRVLSPAPLTRLGDPRRTIISASLDTDIPKFLCMERGWGLVFRSIAALSCLFGNGWRGAPRAALILKP